MTRYPMQHGRLVNGTPPTPPEPLGGRMPEFERRTVAVMVVGMLILVAFVAGRGFV